MANKENLGAGCLMLMVDGEDIWNQHLSTISKEDVNEECGGLENEPHITLLYGYDLENSNEESIVNFMNSFPKEFVCKTKNINNFSNDKFDVLKFEIELSKELELYRKRAEVISTWASDYPDFSPHATLAYLHPKTATKYCKEIEPLEFKVKSLVYSLPNGNRITVYK